MTPDELKGLRVLVVGLGVTGLSVARHLHRHGVPFDVMDSRETVAMPSGATHRHVDLDTADVDSADVIVLSPGIPRSTPAIRRALEAGVSVIGDIELFASACRAPIVAVTGSNGKSTVVAWLAHALQAVDVRAVACGNIGDAALDALADDVDVYVLELSSYQLESTERLAPLAASVLNVSEDHLDRYDGFAEYAATKRRVYRGAAHRVCSLHDRETWRDLELGAADAWVDHPVDERQAAANPGDAIDARGEGAEPDPRVARWHVTGIAPVANADGVGSAANDSMHAPPGGQGVRWLCRNGESRLSLPLALPGRHNESNALAVLALTEPLLERGVGALTDDERVRERLYDALKGWTGLPHRTQRIACRQGVAWYDDSKGTNVEASVRAIEAMPGPVILIAGGLGKGAEFAPLAHVANHLKRAVLIGRDAPRLRETLAPFVPVELVETMEDAVATAAAEAVAGDVVLLSPACASFDMFRDYIARGDAFRAAVERTLGVAS